MRLEREGPLTLTVAKGGNVDRFGLAAGPLREMLSELIEQGFVNGNASAMDDDRSAQDNTRNLASDARLADLNDLRLGRAITVRIGHKGRVRLWRLRDELRADRGRDKFGILFDDRAWERELPVQLLFAGVSGPLSILFLDLDHFKAVNDTRGHPEGDAVLRRWFEIITDIAGDRGYRYGGEEVGVLLPDTELDAASVIAEAIRAKVETEFAGKVPPSTVSIGVTTLTVPTRPEDALPFVDRLLYQAKTQGRNRVVATRYVEG